LSCADRPRKTQPRNAAIRGHIAAHVLFSLHAVRLMFYAIRPPRVPCGCALLGAWPKTPRKCMENNNIAI
jgi:hypothetical protein